MVNIEFRDDIITHLPTACLVEDYQQLIRAIQYGDWDNVQVVADCIAEVIEQFTIVPQDLEVHPSGSSIIAMGCDSGIITAGHKDLRCAAGRPASEALFAGCNQCPNDCRYRAENKCDPEACVLLLEGGILYQRAGSDEDDKLVELLKDYFR